VSSAEELTGAVVQMYGAGLERNRRADRGRGARATGSPRDELVAGLLMIHDLYPVPLEERVMAALDTVRPYMESHGGNIELLGFEDGVVKLRLEGSCKSCRASSSTLELAVRQALQEAAPDLLGMDVEGVVEEAGGRVTGVPLPLVNGAPPGTRSTSPRPSSSPSPPRRTLARRGNVDGTLLAYRNSCASCNSDLADARARRRRAVMSPLRPRYFLPQAGRSMDDDHLQLQPIPLLREAEAIRVAL
jgi:Fe-S cluster biogenesis protein NfuA/nitrite reductase/ring-hydroxylating ferredoxin subunit